MLFNKLVIPLVSAAGQASAYYLPSYFHEVTGQQLPLFVGDGSLRATEHSCPIDLPLSCTNTSEVGDSCCFEYPGGVLLQTQFWDYYPPVGPDDMFTLHGLWPDLCNGQYEQFCDDSSNIDSAQAVLESFGETELLEKMNRVWKNFNGHDDDLWTHEFNKHGTCMSTIKSSCYDQSTYKKNQNVVDFYKKTVEIFETLPTAKWLAENGIVPSEEQTYTKQQISDTLNARFGQPVYFKCNRFNALQEVWYFHHLQGSILTGDFVPIPAMMNSGCPETGIKLLPKNFKPPTPTDPHQPGPKPTGDGMRGFLKPKGQPGCIISTGRWYSSGTCAGFTLVKAPFGGYNMKSSKGWCGINSDGDLECSRVMKAMQFAYDKEDGYLTYGGTYRWSADDVPKAWKQVPIRPGYGGTVEFKLHFEAQ
ncbi:hypothetical protein CANARDRAFT_8867 [[Candida] arabinofermentans NRRL YB-2248]|uniref:Ribonuclease T2-like n=1 Tax=[Candida] arabinofermentans NRRL YB-2248 TaxID=983967 RepID=A0A1E4SXG6_9ASCO|nr:hypothetical protein CANARDRAFT_8867 [[Candida] arabinofermentans NRRL YB-2248]